MSSFIILARVATISPLSGDREVQVSVQSEKNFRERQRVNGSAHLPASDKALDKKWSVQTVQMLTLLSACRHWGSIIELVMPPGDRRFCVNRKIDVWKPTCISEIATPWRS